MLIRIRGADFIVDDTENRRFWQAVATGEWEPETFEVIERLVPPGGLMLDIGCWIGPLTLFAASKSRHVLAVDPDPVAFAALERNLRFNPELAPLVTASNVAIAPEVGSKRLNARREYGASSSSLLRRIGDSRQDVEVECLTLERFLSQQSVERPDLVKIDIEGGEFELIPTLLPLLHRIGFPPLLISFHLGHLNEHLYRKRIGSEIAARTAIKLEMVTGRYLFARELRRSLRGAIAPLRCYPRVTVLGGPEVPSAELENPPLRLGNKTLLFAGR